MKVADRTLILRATGSLIAIDGTGVDAGRIEFYMAPEPAIRGQAVPSSQLIASMPLLKPCGSVDKYGLHIYTPPSAQCLQPGQIAWGRIVSGSGEWVMDGPAALDGPTVPEDAVFILDRLDALDGAFITLVSCEFLEG